MLADVEERLLASLLPYLELVRVAPFGTVVNKGEHGDVRRGVEDDVHRGASRIRFSLRPRQPLREALQFQRYRCGYASRALLPRRRQTRNAPTATGRSSVVSNAATRTDERFGGPCLRAASVFTSAMVGRLLFERTE